ncbi:alpha/beta fold hydrolase [Pseudomonas aeruginosa]|uniref:alpha/beta fold hydrolase n=1 Tax=Pseudomonas aeruginosa TaxID=287 RepID=UPI003AF2B73E
MWDAQLPALTRHFRVLRYDARGHGASSVPPGPYTLARLGEDVLELLDALEVRRAHFLGLSLGGIVGQWLALHAPQRIERLVLANTSAWLGPAAQWDERIAAVLQAEDMSETAAGFRQLVSAGAAGARRARRRALPGEAHGHQPARPGRLLRGGARYRPARATGADRAADPGDRRGVRHGHRRQPRRADRRVDCRGQAGYAAGGASVERRVPAGVRRRGAELSRRRLIRLSSRLFPRRRSRHERAGQFHLDVVRAG